MTLKKILPLGDSSLLIQFGEDIDPDLNRRVLALDALLHASLPQGVIETVPAYASLLVCYDPLVITYAEVEEWVGSHVDRVQTLAGQPSRYIEVPVRYGGERGPDLGFVASSHGLSPREVVRRHTAAEVVVYMMGFTPGFAYMGRLDPAIATPRLETPRTRVPAGSVGIAGAQTGIYPIDSPGGWRLIGWTPLMLFDLKADPPFLFAPGDTVHFVMEALDA